MLNGLVHHRLLTNRPVTWRWMLFLSATEIALITVGIVIGGGFDSFVFMAYHPALCCSSWCSRRLWLGLAWTTTRARQFEQLSYVLMGSGTLGGSTWTHRMSRQRLLPVQVPYAPSTFIPLALGLGGGGVGASRSVYVEQSLRQMLFILASPFRCRTPVAVRHRVHSGALGSSQAPRSTA